MTRARQAQLNQTRQQQQCPCKPRVPNALDLAGFEVWDFRSGCATKTKRETAPPARRGWPRSAAPFYCRGQHHRSVPSVRLQAPEARYRLAGLFVKNPKNKKSKKAPRRDPGGPWSFLRRWHEKGRWSVAQDLAPINCHAPLREGAISCRSGTNVRRPAHAPLREGAIFREGSGSVASPNVGSLAPVDLI